MYGLYGNLSFVSFNAAGTWAFTWGWNSWSYLYAFFSSPCWEKASRFDVRCIVDCIPLVNSWYLYWHRTSTNSQRRCRLYMESIQQSRRTFWRRFLTAVKRALTKTILWAYSYSIGPVFKWTLRRRNETHQAPRWLKHPMHVLVQHETGLRWLDRIFE